MANAIQVDDDLPLLEQMMQESKSADSMYQPTHFWKFYEDRFLPEIREMGLDSFRRRKDSVLASFGGTDPIPHPPRSIRRAIASRAQRLFPSLGSALMPTPEEITRARYRRVQKKFADLPHLKLTDCAASLIGDPDSFVEIDGKPWTATHLEYCSVFADAKRYLDFEKYEGMGLIVEIGSGLGRNAEIWASLYPQITIFLFDIPPQLYVAHQYLKKRFGDRVVSYNEALKLDPNLPYSSFGKIVLLPTWQLPLWSQYARPTIFWNSASFQEMEPDIVVNYLSLIKQMKPKYAYINAMPGGNHHPGSAESGGLGTKNPVLEKYYYEAFQDDYKPIAVYDTDHLDSGEWGHHRSYVFRRNL